MTCAVALSGGAVASVDLRAISDQAEQTPPSNDGPVYRTIDRGDSWTSSSRGLSSRVRSLAIDPARGYVYASTQAGVYRSVDHGDSWLLWYANQPGEGDALIAIDQRDPRTVYLFGPGRSSLTNFSPRQVSVVRLDQDGERRTLLRTFSIDCCEPESIAVSPHDSSVWLGANFALEVSLDQGQTWTRRDLGLPARGTGVAAPALVLFDARRSNVVFQQSIYGVARSADGGLSWKNVFVTRSPYGGPNIPVGLALDPLDSDHFFVSASAGGMYVTDDGGRTWDTPFGIIGQPRNIAVSPLPPFELYTPYSYRDNKPPYTVDWTVAYSRDRGLTWAAARKPPPVGEHIVADTLHPDRAYLIATQSQ